MDRRLRIDIGAPIELRDAGRIQRSKARVRRRDQPAVLQPPADVAAAARRQSAAEQRLAERDDFLTQLNVVDEPLASLPLERVRPGKEALDEIMESLR